MRLHDLIQELGRVPRDCSLKWVFCGAYLVESDSDDHDFDVLLVVQSGARGSAGAAHDWLNALPHTLPVASSSVNTGKAEQAYNRLESQVRVMHEDELGTRSLTLSDLRSVLYHSSQISSEGSEPPVAADAYEQASIDNVRNALHQAAANGRSFGLSEDREFLNKLCDAINSCSRESGSNTPDFLLAGFLLGCLQSFDTVVQRRTAWYGGYSGLSPTPTREDPVIRDGKNPPPPTGTEPKIPPPPPSSGSRRLADLERAISLADTLAKDLDMHRNWLGTASVKKLDEYLAARRAMPR
ncbi:MAG: hypothetical protein E6R03_06790 [Hyphomicrobiaceae bacterium]|nr:MAG: hypothetical protein E6R03_06790 [Hyphomicrobiaceae bacterium]